MKFLNKYKPSPPSAKSKPEDENRTTLPEEYDFNFLYPVTILKSDRVELRPYVPSVHSTIHGRVLEEHPELLLYDDGEPSVDSVFAAQERYRRSPGALIHAIYTAPIGSNGLWPERYEFAGVANLHSCDHEELTAAIGLLVFPAFQRSHTATHAIGLMLKRIMDMPISKDGEHVSEEGGFGYRRVQWRCDGLNEASNKAARRLGFKLEGTRRNSGVSGEGKGAGGVGRPGDFHFPKPSYNECIWSITYGEDVALKEDAENYRAEIQKLLDEGKEVICVGHSYGGMVITEAPTHAQTKEYRVAQGQEGGIVHLLFVAAFLAGLGESLEGCLGGELPPNLLCDRKGYVSCTNPLEFFFHDVPENEAQGYISLLKPVPSLTQFQPLSNYSLRYIPATYLICTDDRALPPFVQQMMVDRVTQQGGKITTESVHAGHSPYMVNTQILIDLIDKVVKSSSSQTA